MTTLEVIRYITQHHTDFDQVHISRPGDRNSDETSAMEAINELASIDPSWYDSYQWTINNTLEKGTLLISRL